MSGAVAGWAAALALLFAAPAAQAHVVSNAQTGTLGVTISTLTVTLGTVTTSVTGGNLASGGNVTQDGALSFPSLTPVTLPVAAPTVAGITAGAGTLTLSSVGPLAGGIDPAAGVADLTGTLTLVEQIPLTLVTDPLLGTTVSGTLDCTFSAVPLNAATGIAGGAAYDQATGALTLAQSSLTLGMPTCTTTNVLLDPFKGALESALGLTSGIGSLNIGAVLSPILKAGPVAVLTADPVLGTVPFSTTLDASHSVAPAGVKEYEWDLNGDGTIDQVTTTPKLALPVTTAGLLTTAVTVVDLNGDSSRAVALITGLLGAITGGTTGGTTTGGTAGGGTTGTTPGGTTGTAAAGGAAATLSAAKVISLPSSRRCVSRRALRLTLHVPKGVTLARVTVKIGRGRTRSLKGGVLRGAPVSLEGLPKGRYMVVVKVTTTDGRTVTLRRTYHTCVAKRKPRR